jgi:hypothetical protein
MDKNARTGRVASTILISMYALLVHSPMTCNHDDVAVTP